MSIVLYYAPRTRAFRPRWLLEEAGAAYELQRINVAAGEQRQPAYLAVNPFGSVPALRDGEQVVLETAAILLHLADRFPEASLAPPPASPERGAYYQWIIFAACTLEPTVGPAYLRSFRAPADQKHLVATDEEKEKFAKLSAPLVERLSDRPFLLGETFSAADIAVGGVLGWAKVVGQVTADSKLAGYLERLEQRPAFVRAAA
jgi:glutathione S-transferase